MSQSGASVAPVVAQVSPLTSPIISESASKICAIAKLAKIVGNLCRPLRAQIFGGGDAKNKWLFMFRAFRFKISNTCTHIVGMCHESTCFFFVAARAGVGFCAAVLVLRGTVFLWQYALCVLAGP